MLGDIISAHYLDLGTTYLQRTTIDKTIIIIIM